MLVLALTSMLLSATTATGEGSAPATSPAPPSAADSVIAAAFGNNVGTKPTEQKAEALPSVPFQSLLAPALGLAGLAALAFTITRRKQLRGGSIHILEAASLGEKRSLVIAEVLGERLVLGVSEAGVSVLMTRPAPAAAPSAHSQARAFGEAFGEAEDLITVPRPTPAAMGFFQRLKGAPVEPAFDTTLQESMEDQELRAKLAAGHRGVVP